MRKIDPNKTIDENYPELNFKSSVASNNSLYDAELEVRTTLNKRFNNYIYIWEYGYYFTSLFIRHSSIHKSYITIAALFTEVHSALRTSFLLNLSGYHADSVVLLRKVHESLIRAIACRVNPPKMWDIIQSSSIGKIENGIGLNLKKLYNVESTFTHSNKMKSFQSGIDLKSGRVDIGVNYGPQINIKEFDYSAKVSIFWLYATIKVLPKLFPGQISNSWLALQGESAELMHDFLENCKSSLLDECLRIDKCLEKITDDKKTNITTSLVRNNRNRHW
jgi:hypothetical protein